jgi:hypothetical protein
VAQSPFWAITDSNGTNVDGLKVGEFCTVTPSGRTLRLCPNQPFIALIGDKTDAVFTGTAI